MVSFLRKRESSVVRKRTLDPGFRRDDAVVRKAHSRRSSLQGWTGRCTPSILARMEIEFSRRSDGRAIMRCVRSDGSVTWQRHDGRYASFFPFHDLTHLAVEMELGFREGFFGLIASGWEISETTGTGARGALPVEAGLVEQLAGLFDRERVGGAVSQTAAEFNETLRQICKASGLPFARSYTDAEIERVRSRRDELYTRWAALPVDETLNISFVHDSAVRT